MLFCNFKKLSVKAVQVVHYQLTEAGIPFDAQGLVFFEQVRLFLLRSVISEVHFEAFLSPRRGRPTPIPSLFSLHSAYIVVHRIMCLTFIAVFNTNGANGLKFADERGRQNAEILFYLTLDQLLCLVCITRRPRIVA